VRAIARRSPVVIVVAFALLCTFWQIGNGAAGSIVGCGPRSAPGDCVIRRRDGLGGRRRQPSQHRRESVSTSSLAATHGLLEPRAAAPPPVAVQRLSTERESTASASPPARAVGVRSGRVVQLVRRPAMGKGVLQALPSARARRFRAAQREASTPQRDAAASMRPASRAIDVRGRTVLCAVARRLESVTGTRGADVR